MFFSPPSRSVVDFTLLQLREVFVAGDEKHVTDLHVREREFRPVFRFYVFMEFELFHLVLKVRERRVEIWNVLITPFLERVTV